MAIIGNYKNQMKPDQSFQFPYRGGLANLVSNNKIASLRFKIIIFILFLYFYRVPEARSKNNVIFLLVDDLGWSDLGCYGNSWYETPNIDNLAREGVRFTNAYAASPVSSPTRSAIMTGKNPARTQITQWIGWDKGNKWEADYVHNMALDEVTFAEALKDEGYATGFFGKWHLGETEPFWPQHQGFDVNVGGCGWGRPINGWFSPYNNPQMSNGPNGEHLTERLTQEALKFLDTHKNDPFLLYFSYYQVHTPLDARQEIIDKYKVKKLPYYYGAGQVDVRNGSKTTQHQKNPTYAAMIEHLDISVGAVLKKVRDLGLEDNTIVIFTGDNGGLAKGDGPTSVFPLYAGKAWIFEGGFREPLIIKWPGVTQAGSVCKIQTISMDFYPTILEMLGLPHNNSQHIDGKSLVPILQQKGPVVRDALYFHYPHNHGIKGVRPSSAVRFGDFKLIEFLHDNCIEMYNLAEDPKERVNLINQEPVIANQLRWMLTHWRDTIKANMPPNWPKGAYTPPTNPGPQSILSITEPWEPQMWEKGSTHTIKWQDAGNGNSSTRIALSYAVGNAHLPITGKTSASSQKNDTLAAEFAFDNDLRTRWAAEPDGNYVNEWLEIEFNKSVTFNKAHIKECLDWGQRIGPFTIQVWDGTSWRDCHTGDGIGAAETVTFKPVTGTKARLLIKNATNQPSVWEFNLIHHEIFFIDSITNQGSYGWTLPQDLPDSLKLVLSHRISTSYSPWIKILPPSSMQKNPAIIDRNRYLFSLRGLGSAFSVCGNFNTADIVDIKGRTIKTFHLNQERIIWDLTNDKGKYAAKGLYWIRFQGKSQQVIRKLLVCH